MIVELIYEQSCPNIASARTRLLKAFQRARLTPEWQEWEVNREDTPERARKYGSPTILVNGRDVGGGFPHASANCCRVYHTGSGFETVPAMDTIVNALRSAAKPGGSRRWSLAALPSVGTALLPKLTCPICWPAYTALLGSAGIGFIDYTPYLLPMIALFLAVTLSALAYQAKARRGYGPFWTGVLGSISIVAGKFIMESEAGLYLGVALLLGASLWNLWPRRATRPLRPSQVSEQ